MNCNKFQVLIIFLILALCVELTKSAPATSHSESKTKDSSRHDSVGSENDKKGIAGTVHDKISDSKAAGEKAIGAVGDSIKDNWTKDTSEKVGGIAGGAAGIAVGASAGAPSGPGAVVAGGVLGASGAAIGDKLGGAIHDSITNDDK